MLHDVDHDEERREETEQIPIDSAIKLIDRRLVADQHNRREAQRDEAHAQIADHRQHRCRRDRQNERDEHYRAEPEETPTLDAVVLVERADQPERVRPIGGLGDLLDLEELRAEHDGEHRRDGDEWGRLDEKLDEADTGRVADDDVRDRADQRQQPADVGEQPLDHQEPEQQVLSAQLAKGNAGERADDDHRGDVVEDRREDDGHQPVEPEKPARVALGGLRQFDRDPGKQARLRRHVDEQARPENEPDDAPIDRGDVDGKLDQVSAPVAERREFDDVFVGVVEAVQMFDVREKQTDDREHARDDRLLGVDLFLERETDDKPEEQRREQQRDR